MSEQHNANSSHEDDSEWEPNKVRDFAEVQAKFLQTKLRQSLDERERMQSISRTNLEVLRRVHQACIQWLYMGRFLEALEWMHRQGPSLFQVNIMTLAIESDDSALLDPTDIPGPIYLDKGGIDRYMSADQSVMLTNVVPAPATLFGRDADQLRSWAAVRLDYVKSGLLLLASTNPKSYSENQGSDLLEFFAKIVEFKLRHWQP